MIGPRVRILAGVAAAVLAVVLLLEDGSDSVPAERLATGGAHDAPAALAADASARLAPAPGGVAAPPPAPTVAPPDVYPTPRSAQAGIRGRIDFGGALPPGLSLRVVPDRDRDGKLRTPVDVVVAPDGTFLVPLPEGIGTQFRVAWEGGSVEVRREPTADGSFSFGIRLGSGRLEGHVLDAEGAPVPGVHIRDDFHGGAFGETTSVRRVVTDSGGRWSLDHLPAGTHTIQAPRPPALPTGGRGNAQWVQVRLAAGEHRTLDLGYSATDATWVGRLRLRSGRPLTGGGRICLSMGANHTCTSYDGEGRFVMRAAPGAYTVVVEPHGPRRSFVLDPPPELHPATTPPSSPDSIVLVSDIVADVVLVGGSVSGRVSGIDPKAMELAELGMAFRAATPGSQTPRSGADRIEEALAGADRIEESLDRSGAEGRFTAQALPPGRYVIAGFRLGDFVDLVGPDGRPVVVDVVDGGEITGLELRVAPL